MVVDSPLTEGESGTDISGRLRRPPPRNRVSDFHASSLNADYGADEGEGEGKLKMRMKLWILVMDSEDKGEAESGR